ncbi:hypothetical protein SNR26_20110 [Pectobacterium brasiliense]|uniref:hypothetical protein n=1 Tax=Pectobacterium brasiliense TaxID=180957 RepID=UPI002A82D73E|nr:hypothetical protein [Pectobacterium brasiliense]MDY4370012.1 hypothetical protein [Pectobacterium brasiliense]MDY7059544.1 hypothetical protein [Pectobacterium brasiliense]
MKGELYNGGIAYGIANKILHFDHCALVENPLDKRCAIAIEDNSEQFGVQKNLSEYMNNGKLPPFGFKNIEIISYKKIILIMSIYHVMHRVFAVVILNLKSVAYLKK